jgi:hypothetical protein
MVRVTAHVGRPAREREPEVAPEGGDGLGQGLREPGALETVVGRVDVEPESEQREPVEYLVALDKLLKRSRQRDDVRVAEDDDIALGERESRVVGGAETAAALAYVPPVQVELQFEQRRAAVVRTP